MLKDWNVQARGTNEAAIFSHYEAARQLRRGKLPQAPRMISFWPADCCNLSCAHCYYQHCGALMDVENFMMFADEAYSAGVESLEASGGGEPTMNGRFYEMMHYAKSQQLALGLLTNGFWLDVDYLLADFDYVRISVDAATEKTYQELKQPKQQDAFTALCQTIRCLTAERDRRKSKLKVILKMLLSKQNMHEIVEFSYWGVKLNVDAIHYKPAHSSRWALNQEERQRANEQIEYVREHVFENTLGNADYEIAYTGKCFMSPIHAVLRTNGDLMVCCYFDDQIIGNIFEHPFSEVWGSKQHKEVMQKIDMKRCAKVDCRWHRYNRLMENNEKLNLKFI